MVIRKSLRTHKDWASKRHISYTRVCEPGLVCM